MKNTIVEFIDRDSHEIYFDFSVINELQIKKSYRSYHIYKTFPREINSILYPLNENKKLNYSVNADTVVDEMSKKYRFDKSWQIHTEYVMNRIKVVIIYPNIDKNAEMIVSDMERMGYYVGYNDTVYYNDKEYYYFYFEPLYTNEVTNSVLSKRVLYHFTTEDTLRHIVKEGLIPLKNTENLKYPDRLYFIPGYIDDDHKLNLMKQLSDNTHREVNYELIINTEKLNGNLKFYEDPHYIIGIYTYDKIPFDSVKCIKRWDRTSETFDILFKTKSYNSTFENKKFEINFRI